MKILKCLLMIVTAPVFLVLTLFVWLCTGLIYISGLVLGLSLIHISIPADPNVKNYSYAIVDGQVYYRENSRMVRPDLNATAEAREGK